jgi:beta-glucanase (GH16 family)
MKNKLIILTLIFFSPFMVFADPPSNSYKLVHSDDFSTDAVNIGDEYSAGYPLDNGNITGTCSWPLKKNVNISDGKLNVSVIHETTPNPQNSLAEVREFSAGAWHTFITFRYGYFETKIKVSQLDQLWGCFWLLKGGQFGPYQEIDIMEFMTGNNPGCGYLSCSQHWWQDKGLNANNTKHWSTDYHDVFSTSSHLDEYHTYGCEWTPTHIRFFIDGNLWSTMENYDLHDPMFVVLSMGRQHKNNWCGDDLSMSKMEVDYLKVWQKPDISPDVVYTKGEKNKFGPDLNSLTAIGTVGTSFNEDNMFHMAWYPQGTYTMSWSPQGPFTPTLSSPNMSINQVGWAYADGDWNGRGELTKGFQYICNTPGIYQVTIHLSTGEFETSKTFTIIVGGIDYYFNHLVIPCLDMDIIADISSTPMMMDRYEVSLDYGSSWSQLNSYDDPSPGYNFQVRGILNGQIMPIGFNTNTHHTQDIISCSQYLVSNIPKSPMDKAKLDKIIEDHELKANSTISNKVSSVKSETYKTFIYNLSGQLIKTCDTNQNQVKDHLAEFSSGMYFVHQFDKNGKRISLSKVSWIR